MENKNKHHSEEEHHIVSYAANIKIWIVLLLLTWITITAAFLNFGTMAVAVALLIANVKAIVVLAYYMHLKFDSKILTIFFIITMAVFTTFIVLTFLIMLTDNHRN
jgi:cytochrome c oxidase subunit 4